MEVNHKQLYFCFYNGGGRDMIMNIKDIMYLGNPHKVAVPSILQLTAYYTELAASTVASHISIILLPITFSNSKNFDKVRQNLQQHTLTQHHPQPQLQWAQERMEKIEQALSENTKKVNEQTLEAFHEFRSELINRLNAHDQAFVQRTHLLSQLEQKWNTKGEQQLNLAKTELKLTTEQLQKHMETKVVELLEQERVEAEKIRKHKFNQLTKELKKKKTQVTKQLKILGEQLREEIKEVVREEQKAKENLEERIILRIKEESEVVQVLNKKIDNLEHKNKFREIREKMEEQMKKIMKSTPKLPYSHLFNIQQQQHNNITFQGDDQWHQMLLDAVVPKIGKFVFNVEIISMKKRFIGMGVVDRSARAQEKSSWASGQAVCYFGGGDIWYGQQGRYKLKETSIKLQAGAKVKVEVELSKGIVAFTIYQGTSTNRVEQFSNILTQTFQVVRALL